MKTPMLALAMFASIGQESAADSLAEVSNSRKTLQAAVERYLDHLEAADAISNDDSRRLHAIDANQAPRLIGAPGANETSRRLQVMPVIEGVVAGVRALAPYAHYALKAGEILAEHYVSGKVLGWMGLERRLETAGVDWKSTNSGVNVGLKKDALHKGSHETAALALGLRQLAGHEEFAKMSNPDIAARLSAALVHDLTKVTKKMTVANTRNPTHDDYLTYSSLKNPEKPWKVASATNLAQILVDKGSANGRRLSSNEGWWKTLTDWFSKGMDLGFWGQSTAHVIKNDVMTSKVQDAMTLYDSHTTTTDTGSKIGTPCTCEGNGGCSCSWAGANREFCGNDDGTPCYANCCTLDANDKQCVSPCRALCNEKKWTSPQSCYQEQCKGCQIPKLNDQVHEVCADCAENNCHNTDLISQWEVEKALETKPWMHSQLVQISVCLGVGIAATVALSITVMSRSHRQSGHGPYSIPNQQEDAVAGN